MKAPILNSSPSSNDKEDDGYLSQYSKWWMRVWPHTHAVLQAQRFAGGLVAKHEADTTSFVVFKKNCLS